MSLGQKIELHKAFPGSKSPKVGKTERSTSFLKSIGSQIVKNSNSGEDNEEESKQKIHKLTKADLNTLMSKSHN